MERGGVWTELPPGNGAYDKKGQFSRPGGDNKKAERSMGGATLTEGGAAFRIDLSED